jgi:hypothetical protein
MKTEFKKGDTVYCGTQKGEVTEQNNDNTNMHMHFYAKYNVRVFIYYIGFKFGLSSFI